MKRHGLPRDNRSVNCCVNNNVENKINHFQESQESLFDHVMSWSGKICPARPFSMLDRIKQTLSCNICCCVKPTDSQTKCTNIKMKISEPCSFSILENIFCRQTVSEVPEETHRKRAECFEKIKSRIDYTEIPEIKQSGSKKCMNTLSKICKKVTNKSKPKKTDEKDGKKESNPKDEKHTDVKNKTRNKLNEKVKHSQVYELSEEEVKSLKEKGRIKLNVKLKPGVTMSDFNIIIQRDKFCAPNNNCCHDGNEIT
uniref:Uncharacterized protein n=1 Tax=Cacopsylla melanoneura TaxID=428564 RepID=A0A8D8VWT7_9HEMI